MIQNYFTDIGYPYFAVAYSFEQILVIPEIVNESAVNVLNNLLPVLRGQILNGSSTCFLPKGITPRRVIVELQNGTQYQFDIPFNSASPLWNQLITELQNPLIEKWEIIGEKITGNRVKLLLTKV